MASIISASEIPLSTTTKTGKSPLTVLFLSPTPKMASSSDDFPDYFKNNLSLSEIESSIPSTFLKEMISTAHDQPFKGKSMSSSSATATAAKPISHSLFLSPAPKMASSSELPLGDFSDYLTNNFSLSEIDSPIIPSSFLKEMISTALDAHLKGMSKSSSSSSAPAVSYTVRNRHFPVNWKVTPLSDVIEVEVPGLKKDQVKLEVDPEGRTLTISCEKALEKNEKDETWRFHEIRSGKFNRKFSLPENAKVEEMKAAMEDGVLTVTIPKVQVPVKIPKIIDISG